MAQRGFLFFHYLCIVLIILGLGAGHFLTFPWDGHALSLALTAALALLVGSVIVFVRSRRGRDENADSQEDEKTLQLRILREAIQKEAKRFESSRVLLEDRMIAYSEMCEFPDFRKLDEQARSEATTPGREEAKLSEMIEEESEAMLGRFSKGGGYFVEGQFQHPLLLKDLLSFMESVAKQYRPDAQHPLLEMNLESLLKAVNRTALQLILVLEEIPLIKAHEVNLASVAAGLRKASGVVKTYRQAEPYLSPLRYALQGSKFLAASNPLVAAGWIASSELLVRGGKKLGKKAIDVYFLSLLRQTVGIIARETASLYDPKFRHRNAPWALGVELAHLASCFQADVDLWRKVFEQINRLPIHSAYDRLFLHRCLLHEVSPKPSDCTSPGELDAKEREEILSKLLGQAKGFSKAHVWRKGQSPERWTDEISQRYGIEVERQ